MARNRNHINHSKSPELDNYAFDLAVTGTVSENLNTRSTKPFFFNFLLEGQRTKPFFFALFFFKLPYWLS